MCNVSNKSLKHLEVVTRRFSAKSCSEKFSKINSKTPAPEFLSFSKVAGK